MKFLKKIDKTEIMEKMTRTASKCGYKLKKASPTIMIVGAAIGGVTATVLACKATIKAQDILTEHNAQVESIHTTKQQIESGEIQLSEGETYTENDYKSDITTTYVKTGLKLAKVYAPAVTLGAVSLGCMFGSHHIMSKRNASLTAAYIALDKAFEEYKSRVSDRFVEDGSYLRVKNITLSYTFPKQWLQKLQIENARLSLSCENVATITGYSGFDPEVDINGIDLSRYPISRTFSVGLNFNF